MVLRAGTGASRLSKPVLSENFIRSGFRAVRQNHCIIRVDAFEGAKLSHGETVSGKAKGRPRQEGRHPRCRPRARAHPPSIRSSPPGTVQGAAQASTHTVRTAPEEPWHRSNPNLDNPL